MDSHRHPHHRSSSKVQIYRYSIDDPPSIDSDSSSSSDSSVSYKHHRSSSRLSKSKHHHRSHRHEEHRHHRHHKHDEHQMNYKQQRNKKEADVEVELESEVIKIRNRKDHDNLIHRNIRCVIFYGASWCSACHEMMEIYYNLMKQFGAVIKFGYCDVEKVKLDFSKVPVFTAVYKGKEMDSRLGADKEGLKELVMDLAKLE